jgi:1,4-dihydroxy-6-naphthoate synthase
VLVPGEGTTANFLLDFWFRSEHGGAGKSLRKRFAPFDSLYRELRDRPDAQGVVIHEMRFTYARDGLRLVRDLGEIWESATGSPIPLGAVAYREGPGMPPAREIEAAIRASLDWSRAHEQEALDLCAHYAQDMNPAVMRAHIQLYVNEFTRNLGGEGQAAVQAFLMELSGSAQVNSK